MGFYFEKGGKMQIPVDKIPPQNIEAEKAVIGAGLMDKNALGEIVEIIKEPECFYATKHQLIFREMIKLAEKGEAVDLLTVSNALRNSGSFDDAGGAEYITGLLDMVPTVSNASYYAQIVKDKSVLRSLISAGMSIVSNGYNEDEAVDAAIDKSEQEIFALSQKSVRNDFVPIKSIMASTFEKLEELYKRQAHVTGVPSGFQDLDYLTAGFQGGNLVIVAARPSMGKTALCLNMAQNMAIKEKIPVGIFSLEMPKEELALRFLCSLARIDGSRLKTGHLQENDWPRLTQAINALSEAPIYIDDSGSLTAMEIRSKARRMKSKHNIGIIIIDYLQLMKGNPIFKGDVNKEVSDMSRQLKSLAKELNIPVIALAQLNRAVESRTDKRPMLSDLRDSGGIEQDADLVCFIYRDSYYTKKDDNKTSEIIIAKHRNGPVGTINLVFLSQYATFQSLDSRFSDK